MRIGFVETYLTVSEAESITLEIQLLEGTIAPELGNIVVTVSTSDQTALGGPLNIITHFTGFTHACFNIEHCLHCAYKWMLLTGIQRMIYIATLDP